MSAGLHRAERFQQAQARDGARGRGSRHASRGDRAEELQRAKPAQTASFRRERLGRSIGRELDEGRES